MAVPAYFILVPDANMLGGDKFPAPSALVWRGVAQVLSQGLRTLPPSAVQAVIVAFVLGVLIVISLTRKKVLGPEKTQREHGSDSDVQDGTDKKRHKDTECRSFWGFFASCAAVDTASNPI
jgi:membrane protein implicated in regulation of membrane protease activity